MLLIARSKNHDPASSETASFEEGSLAGAPLLIQIGPERQRHGVLAERRQACGFVTDWSLWYDPESHRVADPGTV